MLRPYVSLFREAPGLTKLSALAFLGRVPSGMMGIALVLLLEGITSSYAVAGAGVGLFATGAAAAGLLYGLAIARAGYRVILIPGGIAAGIFIAFLPVVATNLATLPTLAWCFAAGATYPPLAACIRSQWNRAYSQREMLTRASAFESVVGEMAFLIGPLLVSVAVIAGSERWAFPVAGGLVALSSVAFGASAVSTPLFGPGEGGMNRSWLRRQRFIAVLAAGFLWCVSFGVLSVTVIAAAEEAGSPDAAGILLALLSAGAIGGGLGFGARRWRADIAILTLIVLALYGLLILPLAAGADILPLLGFLLVLTGSTSAIVLAGLNLRVVEGVTPAAEVEAYGWLFAATVAGLALGPAIGGQLIDTISVQGSFVAASVAALVGAAALVIDVRQRDDLRTLTG